MNIQTAFDIGDRVHIDGCPSIVGIVTAVEIRPSDVVRYEVSWVINGDARFVILDEWRLSPIGLDHPTPRQDDAQCKASERK